MLDRSAPGSLLQTFKCNDEEPMTQPIYHHKFRPWRVVGDQRIVAAESTWKKPINWERDKCPECRGHGVVVTWSGSLEKQSLEQWSRDCETCTGADEFRPRVLVDVDVFDGWPGRVVDSKGREIRDEILNQTFTLDDVRDRLAGVWDATPNMTWLVLTKRPENIRRMLPEVEGEGAYTPAYVSFGEIVGPDYTPKYLRENVWLGVSIACQDDADRLIPEVLKCRDLCAKTFLSIEPLIGAVDLMRLDVNRDAPHYDCLIGRDELGMVRRGPTIDWVIVGGESGPNARPCDVGWIRPIVRQCRVADVPVFVKQAGAHVIDMDVNSGEAFADEMCWPEDTKTDGCRVLLSDKKGGDPSEWPEDLRVREVPQ